MDALPSDDYLVERAQDGYLQAYEELVRRHRERVYRVALRMLGEPFDAEDAAQEALVRAWRALPGFRGESTFASWVYGITVRCCQDVRRRRGRPTPLDPDDAPRLPAAEDVVVERERLAAVGAALQTLPVEQRAVVVLSQFEGLSYAEVATILGTTEATVRGRLFRARRRLLAALRDWS